MAIVICSGGVNRYGFRVLPEGIRLENYRKNPVLLVWHEMSGKLPIGKLNNLRVEGGQLIADDPEWDEDDDFALKVKGKYEKGMMNACSLNVDPITISEDVALILPGQYRPTVTESELLEVSMVSVPGDAGAVKLSHEGNSDVDKILPRLADSAPETKTKDDMDFKAIALSLGLSENATEAEVVAAANKLKQEAEAARLAEINSLIKLGRDKGLVTDANEAAFKLMATNNPAEMKTMLDSMANTAATANTGTPTQTLTEKMVQLSAGATSTPNDPNNRDAWSFDDWSRKDPDGLLLMKQSNLEKYKALALAYAKKGVAVLVLLLLSFVAVNGQVRWPAGKADFQTITVNAADSTASATVTNGFTHLTISLTKNTTLNLDTPKKLREGDLLFVDAASGAVAKSLTCGDKLQCPVISGTINKGRQLMFVFNGTKYVLVANTQYN